MIHRYGWVMHEASGHGVVFESGRVEWALEAVRNDLVGEHVWSKPPPLPTFTWDLATWWPISLLPFRTLRGEAETYWEEFCPVFQDSVLVAVLLRREIK